MRKNKKYLLLISLCFMSCSTTIPSINENRNLDPSTMTLEDYKDIDFSWIKYGKVDDKVAFDSNSVEVKNKRTPASDEVEVKMYFFENDIFKKAEYHYLKVGQDYSSKGEYCLDIEYYDPNSWTGLESNLSLIGLYSDPQFNNLIDPKLIESVSNELDEIYVRAASDIYTYRYINEGTYSNGDYTFTISDNILTCVVNDVKYKLTSINNQMESNLYVNDVLIEDRSRFDFTCDPWGLENIYRRAFFALYLDGEYIVPAADNYSNYFNTRAYSIFAYL